MFPDRCWVVSRVSTGWSRSACCRCPSHWRAPGAPSSGPAPPRSGPAILAAQPNGIRLGLIALGVGWSAVPRLVEPQDVRGGLVLGVALGGVAVSVAASIVLARASRESLNVRGAFLHVLTDVAAF